VGRRRAAGSAPWTTSSARKLVRAFGISVNRWEPANVLKALRTEPHRQRPGRLQRLRLRTRRTSCSRCAASTASR
jgi:hypothetical protein